MDITTLVILFSAQMVWALASTIAVAILFGKVSELEQKQKA